MEYNEGLRNWNEGGNWQNFGCLYMLFKFKQMGFRVDFKDLTENMTGKNYLEGRGFRRDPKPELVIYDMRPSGVDNSQDVTVLVTEVPFLPLETLRVVGKKILVLNKMSPFPDKFMEQVDVVKGLVPNFDSVVLVPFNGGLFNWELQREPALDKLALIVAGKSQERLVFPFVEKFDS